MCIFFAGHPHHTLLRLHSLILNKLTAGRFPLSQPLPSHASTLRGFILDESLARTHTLSQPPPDIRIHQSHTPSTVTGLRITTQAAAVIARCVFPRRPSPPHLHSAASSRTNHRPECAHLSGPERMSHSDASARTASAQNPVRHGPPAVCTGPCRG